MIAEHVRDFLESHHFMAAASRDDQLQPCLLRAFGLRIHSDHNTVTFYIPAKGSSRMIADWRNNGRVALIIVSAITHESYQLKGKFVSDHPNNDVDHQNQDEYVKDIQKQMIDGGFPSEYISGLNFWNCKPGLAISFQVESVFDQTPGSEAGEPVTET